MKSPPGRALRLALVLVATALATVAVTFTLVRIFEHKQAAQSPFLRLVALDETSVDPVPWGQNWPHHFEQYRGVASDAGQGGSSALPPSKLATQPWLTRLYAGYAFSIDYREARGHAYMLHDQTVTRRVTERSQAGACLHCHASTSVLYRKVGLDAMGLPSDHRALAAAFDMPAVMRGFEVLSRRPYADVLALLAQMPDQHRSGEAGSGSAPGSAPSSGAHPVACIDCHDPETLQLRITRPGFMLGIAALAASPAAVPHLPSIERWRGGSRATSYDPNRDASRQELRSFVCGQCHVEYYCATSDTLTFPWRNGLRVEQLEETWESHRFADGTAFFDWRHAETGAPMFKAQHPEFELWSQGLHAAAGVSCADCHMPYQRVGAMKLSSHDVKSPLADIGNACRTCHPVSDEALRDRVATIQQRTLALTERAAVAMTDMLDAIGEARAGGVHDTALADVFVWQRKAMWRLDYISSENSRGFHAGQEAARILAESIDYSRQAQAQALRLRVPQVPGEPPGAPLTDRG